ncbi:hypothetical protein [Nocardia sp. 348MFTsu5.1]|uniref:hypothetical protein n=1 Tax=Nocardia sp. 348MFTsu5.1 TaxID=1172185 RepID=UPI00035F8D4A|nr:hypothetical protein [Nocardia sp. 348MFTsu5.1]
MTMGQRYGAITDDLRALAVDHVTALLPHTTSTSEAVRLVAEQFSVSENSVRNWMRRAGVDPNEHTNNRRLADANATIAVLTDLNRALTDHLTHGAGD